LDSYALIGRDISHSRSPELYRRFIGPHIKYDLLDITSESSLPTVEHLATLYRGVNITAPWKEHYAGYAVASAQRWGGVNCLRFRDAKCEATNTDASALREIIPQLNGELKPQSWVVLGDGVMGKMMVALLEELGLPAKNYSRKKGDDLSQLNLSELYNTNQTKIVVNACARSFEFTGNLDGTWVFWDLNYAHKAHEASLPQRCQRYIDGFSLLETQARHAVMFWESHE